MTPTDFRREVSRLNQVLLETEVALEVNGAVARREGQKVLVTWPSQTTAAMSDHVFASMQEYRHLLKNREYTALLWDGAMLQISASFNRDVLVAQRFCYYPCPLVLEPEDADDIVELFDLRLAEELVAQEQLLASSAEGDTRLRLRMRGPLRFDFDHDNARSGHSASHLHVLTEDSRWPVYGPLSIGHFVRFVFTHFYPAFPIAALTEWPLNHTPRTVLEVESLELYIECRHEL
jgi:hypothetical protein